MAELSLLHRELPLDVCARIAKDLSALVESGADPGCRRAQILYFDASLSRNLKELSLKLASLPEVEGGSSQLRALAGEITKLAESVRSMTRVLT